ncbi:MAG: hypothetical protein V3U03_17395 [Myxococcota bacterium]
MKVKTAAYARMMGCTSRSIVRMIERGLPARKKGGVYQVDVDQADRWIEEHAPRVWNRTNRSSRAKSPRSRASSARGPGRRGRPAAAPPAAASSNGDLGSQDSRLRRLDAVLGRFIEHLEGDQAVNLDARAVNGIKQLSTELRMLDRHRREMLEADGRLMPRDEARRTLATIGRIVAEEIEAFVPSSPDLMLSALTAGGVKLRNPAKVLKLLGGSAQKLSDQLRERIADAIEAMEF